jgi:hypothetical protein
MRPRSPVGAGLFVAIALFALPASARGSQVDLYDDPYSDYTVLDVFSGFENEANTVTLEGDARRVRVTDATAPLFAGSNCVPDGLNAAVCAAPSGHRLTYVQTYLGSGRDKLTDDITGLRTSSNFGFGGIHFHNGGDGRDRIIGSDGDPDQIYGGNNDDVVRGRGGDDTIVEDSDLFGFGADSGDDDLRGGAGDDVLTGGDGSDLLVGGPGIDRVDYTQPLAAGDPGVRVDLAGNTTGNGKPGEDDQIVSVEDATGTTHADTLLGSPAGSVLDGLAGDDVIVGGPKPDTLFGRSGADRLFAADGEIDRVSCGGPDPGDSAEVDAADSVSGCPKVGAGLVVRPAAPGPGGGPPAVADETAPVIDLTVARRIRRGTLLRRGLRVGVRSTDAVPDVATATLLARPRITRAAAGDLVLAERRRPVLRRATLRLKPAKRLRPAVRRGSRLRLRVVVRDPAGNEARRTVRIRIR